MLKRTIFCHGGCGRSVTLRETKIHPADYYLCHSRESGAECEKSLPQLSHGMVRSVDMYAAANFWGYTYQIADEETSRSIERAQEILAAGIVQQALEKASKRC